MPTPAEIWARAEAKAKREKLELELKTQLLAKKLGAGMEPEYRFDPGRKWRFDFAWPHLWLAVEVEGVGWKPGRHQRREGYAKDCDKYNAAALAGWCVLRFTQEQLYSGTAAETVFWAINERWKMMGLMPWPPQ